MEFRSMFQNIFGKKDKEPENVTRLEYINDWQTVFTSRGTYSDDILIRTCVDTIARHAAKLNPTHVKTIGGKKNPVDSSLMTLLTVAPNPYMTAFDFFYKVAAHVFSRGNAYISIQRDNYGRVLSLWPLDYSTVEPKEKNDDIYLQFIFTSGKRKTIPYADVIHIRHNFQDGELIARNESNLDSYMKLLDTLQKSFANAAVNSGKIKGIASIAGQVGSKNWQEKSQLLNQQLHNPANGGIVTTDSTINFVPVAGDPVAADTSQLDYITECIYHCFGISKNIVNGTFNEQEWQAFFEGTIEPYAIALSQEFSRKLFTSKELADSNRIIFDANRLTYASTATKVELIRQLRPLGILTTNQALEILNLPPVEDGNDRVQTLNVANVNLVDRYQQQKRGRKRKDTVNNDDDTAE